MLDIYEAAPGSEIASGKFVNPASSAALAANMFGPGVSNPSIFNDAPAIAPGEVGDVRLEAIVRFPWRGGRHPCLDALVSGDDWITGVESKRYEPFRGKSQPSFSEAFDRPVWAGLDRHDALRRAIITGAAAFTRLDAGQLIKHALALGVEALHTGKAARLVYLFAEPKAWLDGSPVNADALQTHRAETAAYLDAVSGDAVQVEAVSYRELLTAWTSKGGQLGHHAHIMLDAFDI